MANSVQTQLLAEYNADPAAVATITIKSTIKLDRPETAAALGVAMWPDDSTLIPAVVTTNLYPHATPDTLPSSRNGNPMPFRSVVKVDLTSVKPYTDTQQPPAHWNMVQMDNKSWCALEYLDLLRVAMPIPPIVVPYYSELASDAGKYRNDCGVACARMEIDLVHAKQGLAPLAMTTNQLSDETGLASSDVGLTTQQLVDLAAKHSVKLTVSNNATLTAILAEVRAGRPPICLISYAPILNRQDKAFAGGHFVIPIGCTADSIILNDPDWQGTGGLGFVVPFDQFEAALNTAQVHYQAAFLDGAQLTPQPGQRFGVDLSHWEKPDMPALEAKYDFVFDKASQGVSYVDPDQFNNKVSAFKANPNALWGVFHFGNDAPASAQIDNFIQHGGFDGKTVAVLDVETNPTTGEVTMSLARVIEFVQQFHTKTGVWITIYTSKHMMDALGTATPEQAAILKNCPLWVASDMTPPELPLEWTNCEFIQYGKTVEGFDADRFNGDAAALKAWWAANAVPAQAPAPVPPPVAVNAPLCFHVMPRANYNGILACMKALNDAGKPMPYIKLVDVNRELTSDSTFNVGGVEHNNISFLSMIKVVSPSTKIVMRVYDGTWEQETHNINWSDVANMRALGAKMAQEYIDKFITPNPEMQKVECHQLICEPSADDHGTPLWWLGVLDTLDKTSYKTAVYCFSVGFPGLPDPDHSNFWLSQNELLARVYNGGNQKHLIGLDEYIIPLITGTWTNDFTIMRHERIDQVLDSKYQSLKFINLEWGSTGSRDHWQSNNFYEGYKQAHAYYQQHKVQIVARFTWLEGTGGDDGWLTDQVAPFRSQIQAGLLAGEI